MGLFGKKNTKSTLRFCQSATELDTSHLFSDWDLELAISRLKEWHHHALEPTTEAYAYGLVHDIYGNGQPLLPVEVNFSFSHPYCAGDIGHGSVWKTDIMGEAYYKAEIMIHDPDRRIYDAFRRVFEHAAMSGSAFTHLVLRREKKPHTFDHKERDALQKAERARIKELMKQVEAGEADMPPVIFDRVAFEDNLFLKAPTWTHEWHDDVLNRAKYHSREAAKWRDQPWRS